MSHLLKKIFSGGAAEMLFLNEDLSDVTIIVKKGGQPWRFPAHKLLLSAQSQVFRRMMESDFAESRNQEIVIEDVSPTAMEQFLRHIYNGKLKLENWKEAIELLRAAHMYQVEPLVQECGRFLEDVISLSNVCYIYNEATIYSLSTLKEKCIRLVLDAGFVVLRSKNFETLSKDSVMEIVANSNLNVDSELTVFDALLRWALMECCRTGRQVTEGNILSVLEPFLQYVCFDDMSDTDKSALPSSILSCVKPNDRNRIVFSVLDTLISHSVRLNFDIDNEIIDPHGGRLNFVRFSVDTPIYLIGLRFVLTISEISQSFHLYFIKEQTCRSIMFRHNLAAAGIGGLRIDQKKLAEMQILLRQPARLEASVVYKLYVADRGQDVQCPRTKIAQNTILTGSGHVNFSFHSEKTAGITSLIFIQGQ